MSFVFANPESMASAATDLAAIRSAVDAARTAALGPTTQLQAAAADEISQAITAIFGQHALSFQTAGAQATALHQQFAQALNSGAGAYALAEATNVQQTLLDAINAPTQALLGRPLIGDGANGTATSPNGGAGGLLYGNGGNGYSQAAGSGAPGGSGGAAGTDRQRRRGRGGRWWRYGRRRGRRQWRVRRRRRLAVGQRRRRRGRRQRCGRGDGRQPRPDRR